MNITITISARILTQNIEEKEAKEGLNKRIRTNNSNILHKYKKLTKHNYLNHAVLYLVQHPELMTEDPISTERLLLCCWESKSLKNLIVVMDMLVEAGVVITLDELEEIILEFIKEGIHSNENLHKYVQYLCFAKVYSLSPKIWKEYLEAVLIFSMKIFNDKLPGIESLEQNMNYEAVTKNSNYVMDCLTGIYKNTCK